MTMLLGLIAGLSIACLWVPPPGVRRLHDLHRDTPSDEAVGLNRDQAMRSGIGTVFRRFAAWALRREGAKDQGAIVGGILVAVAARLRAGQSPQEAWRASLEAKPEEIVRALAAVVPEAGEGGHVGHVRRPDAVTRTAIASAGAATQVARTLGAELAGVLQTCAEGIEEAARAAADRVAALSGPKSTARLLMGLPLAGVFLGTVMGAKPLSFLTGTWWGAVVLAAAILLTLIGHWWIRRLITRAALAEGLTPNWSMH